ncbi:unnamed protein product [Trichobilharzia szidati]|nr:unnamed protein product [Trichobilharzia szidati]
MKEKLFTNTTTTPNTNNNHHRYSRHSRLKGLFLHKLPSIFVGFFGIYLFLHGFLLNRAELHNVAGVQPDLSIHYPQSTGRQSRLILLLVDALAYEFIREDNNTIILV